MRFKRSAPRAVSDDERVLPLINIVFLLLIFFILAGRLVSPDAFRVEPPRSASEARAEQRELVVLVDAEGRIALDGAAVEPDALAPALRERLSGGAEQRVRLKADGAAEAGRVVAVMESIREAGATTVDLIAAARGR